MTCNVWKQESERSEDEVKDFFLKLFLQPYPAKAFIPDKESQTDFGITLWEAEEDDQVMFEMFKIFKMYKMLRRVNKQCVPVSPFWQSCSKTHLGCKFIDYDMFANIAI